MANTLEFMKSLSTEVNQMKIKGPIVLKAGKSFAGQIAQKIVDQGGLEIGLPFKAENFKHTNKDIKYDADKNVVLVQPETVAPAKERVPRKKKVITNPSPKKADVPVSEAHTLNPEKKLFENMPFDDDVCRILYENFSTIDALKLATKKELIKLPRVGRKIAGDILNYIEVL